MLEVLLVLSSGRHGVKLFPLIDVDEQSSRPFRRGVEPAINDTGEYVCVARTIELSLLSRYASIWPSILGRGSERGRKGPIY